MSTEDRLVTLGEASRMLGVKETTLRYWANQGRVPSARTPGGHRRFHLSQIKALARQPGAMLASELHEVEELALVKVQQRLQEGHAELQEWFKSTPPDVRDRFRLLGRRLMALLVRWALEIGDAGSFEEEARMVGRHHGGEMAREGNSLVSTMVVFAFFRDAALDALPTDRWPRALKVNDQMMLGIVEAYEGIDREASP